MRPTEGTTALFSDEVLNTPELSQKCFDAEARDERWSATTEGMIRSFMMRYRSIVDASVECRTTICLAHAVWPPLLGDTRRRELDSFFEALKAETASWGVDPPRYSHGGGAGSLETRMTLRRRGSSIGSPVKTCGGLDYEELYSRAIETIETPD